MTYGLILCVFAASWIAISSGNTEFTCEDSNTTFLITAQFTNQTFDEIRQPKFTDGHAQKTCLWTLKAKKISQRIKIIIAILHLYHESDRLYVYDGLTVIDSALIGSYGPCAGGELVLYSTTSSMTLMLVSNENARMGSMRILFKALPDDWITCKKIPDSTDTCPTSQGLITQDSGYLTSPSFPSSHSQSIPTNCVWRFYAVSNRRWVIEVHWIGIYKEQYKNDQMRCNYDDMMKFSDPNDQRSPDIESCGCKKPSLVVSKGDELYFKVTSSPNRYRSGFVLTYRSLSLEECPASRSRCPMDVKQFGFNNKNQICTDKDTPLPTTPPPTTTPPTTTPPPSTTPPPTTTPPPSTTPPATTPPPTTTPPLTTTSLPATTTWSTRLFPENSFTAHDKPRPEKSEQIRFKDSIDVQKTQGVSQKTNHDRHYVNGISVVCSKHHMMVAVHLQQIEFLRPSSLRLIDSSCVPESSNDTHVIFRVPLDGCGTYHNTTTDKITYWNQVNGESEETSHHLITRKFQVRLSFDCSYSKRRTLSVSFSPRRKIVYSAADGRGNFTFMMDMYKTDQYKENFDEYPVSVNLGQRLYLQLLVKSQPKLVIFADKCLATPSSNPYSNPKYEFIKNGCSRDETLRYDYKLASYQQFSIKAFRFVNLTNPSVFLHCFVQVCAKDDNNTVCSRGCVEKSGSRKRREVTGDVSDNNELDHLTLGPITIKPEDAPSSKDDVVPRILIIYVIAGILGIIVMVLIAVIIILLVRRTRRNYYRVTIE